MFILVTTLVQYNTLIPDLQVRSKHPGQQYLGEFIWQIQHFEPIVSILSKLTSSTSTTAPDVVAIALTLCFDRLSNFSGVCNENPKSGVVCDIPKQC